MHTTKVKMKDGREISGILWIVRYEEGWFAMTGTDPEDAEMEILPFAEVDIALTENERISINKVGDDDIVARARENGWDGGPADPKKDKYDGNWPERIQEFRKKYPGKRIER